MMFRIFTTAIAFFSLISGASAYTITELALGKSRCYYRSYPEAFLRAHPRQKVAELAILLSNEGDGYYTTKAAARWVNKSEVYRASLGCGLVRDDHSNLTLNCEEEEQVGFTLRPHSTKEMVVMDVVVEGGMTFWDRNNTEHLLPNTDPYNNAYALDLANVQTCLRMIAEIPEQTTTDE